MLILLFSAWMTLITPEATVYNSQSQQTEYKMHTYEARIRLNGNVTTTTVKANSAGQAKKLVQAQFGPEVTVLSVKRID